MKRYLPIAILLIAAACIAASFLPSKLLPGECDLTAFSKLPVQSGGRVQPLDSLASNSLLIIHGNSVVRLEGGRKLTPMTWLADMFFDAATANTYPSFRIDNPEVLGLFGWQQESKKNFSYVELQPFFSSIEDQAAQIEEAKTNDKEFQPTAYQAAISKLHNALIIYQSLQNSLQPEAAASFAAELRDFSAAATAGREATHLKNTGKEYDKDKLAAYEKAQARYSEFSERSYIQPVPPDHAADMQADSWQPAGINLLSLKSPAGLHPVVLAYAEIGDAYRAHDATLFNRKVQELLARLNTTSPRETRHSAFERFFDDARPFYLCMCCYVAVFLLACASWAGWRKELGRAAFYVLILTFAIHTFGLIARMYIQGRPPVTNLYSSAIFIGWGAVLICLFIEPFTRLGIATAASTVIGFVTLLIADSLAASGDTLEMLQPVLDTNIWLATHVVVISFGYVAMFLAGLTALFYVLFNVALGLFASRLTPAASKAIAEVSKVISGIIYGVICFATLFSFVGTVLGGIWADQSWGRFWGWDPKENGALLIVLWCAIILHARWGGYIRQRGLACLAIAGNIITSFSWFGVNMLGVGLHSYGFMERALPWLIGFCVSQAVIMCLCLIPEKNWIGSRNNLPGQPNT